MAKQQSKFTKEELELLHIIMRQLNKSAKDVALMRQKVKRMIERNVPAPKKRKS